MTPPQPTSADQRLYRATTCRIHPVDANLAVLTSDRWSSGRPVAASAAAALVRCLAERTLDDHRRVVADSLGQDEQHAAAAVDALVELGLLRPVETPTVADAAARRASANIEVLGIVTADRPATLHRCLTSYLDHLRQHRRSPRVVVVDGSRTQDSQVETERVVSAFNADGVEITYLGQHARRDLRDEARALGLPVSALDWLLPDPGPRQAAGANRNLLLLMTAGRRLLTVDDDTVCALWEAPSRADGVAFVGHAEPRLTRPFRSRAEVLDELHQVDVSLLSAHEALLGQSLFDLANIPGQMRILDDVCVHMLPGLDGSRPLWRVRVTWAGIAGDGAVLCPYPFLLSGGATRDHLSADDEAFRTALTSREVIRSVRRNTVTDEWWLMTYCAAIDNASLVPPFLPVGTNEDGLFGAMLRMCDPSAFIGQIPYGILHDSGRPPQFPDRAMASATTTRVSDILLWLTEPAMRLNLERDVDVRMRSLGATLIAAGSLAPRLFRSLLEDLIVDAKCRTLRAAEASLASGLAPAYWRQSVRQYQQTMLNSLTAERLCVPAEYNHCASVDEALTSVQGQLSSFGHALQAWPDLWSLGVERRR